VAESIARFAARRNLAFVKYDHESPYWDLLFAHPIGGHAKLVLGQGPSQGVKLSAVAWRDDYDSFTRHIRWLPERQVPKEPDQLLIALDQSLDEVLGWRLDDQFQAATGYQPIWSTQSKQQFLPAQPVFPVPTRVKT